MSLRTARLILWATAAMTVPLPFFLSQTGTVPAARILMLGAITTAVAIVEGTEGMVLGAAAILLAQAALYLAILWFVSRVIARLLFRAWPRALAPAILVLVAISFAAATGLALYRDPFRGHGLRVNALVVFE
jgi:hypothetical protein